MILDFVLFGVNQRVTLGFNALCPILHQLKTVANTQLFGTKRESVTNDCKFWIYTLALTCISSNITEYTLHDIPYVLLDN